MAQHRDTPRVARLEEMQSVRFPVRDETDPSRVVWFCVEPTPWGVAVTLHQEDPGDDPSSIAGMAQVLVDYFDDRLSVLLWDDDEGPRGDIHWRTPWGAEVSDVYPHGGSIVLVPQVAAWRPPAADEERPKPQEQEEDGNG